MGISPGDLREILRKLLREELTTGNATKTKPYADILSSIDTKTPSLTAAGNRPIAIAEDAVGVAKEATLSSIDGKTPSPTAAGNVPMAVSEDAVGLVKNATLEDRFKATVLATAFDAAVAADADILAADIAVDEDCILRVIVSENTGVIFRAKVVRDAVIKTLDFNEGGALKANALYTFDLPVRAGDSVNFRMAAATTVHVLNVMKVRAMGP